VKKGCSEGLVLFRERWALGIAGNIDNYSARPRAHTGTGIETAVDHLHWIYKNTQELIWFDYVLRVVQCDSLLKLGPRKLEIVRAWVPAAEDFLHVRAGAPRPGHSSCWWMSSPGSWSTAWQQR